MTISMGDLSKLYSNKLKSSFQQLNKSLNQMNQNFGGANVAQANNSIGNSLGSLFQNQLNTNFGGANVVQANNSIGDSLFQNQSNTNLGGTNVVQGNTSVNSGSNFDLSALFGGIGGNSTISGNDTTTGGGTTGTGNDTTTGGGTTGTGTDTTTGGTTNDTTTTGTGYSPLIDKLTGDEKEYALSNDLTGDAKNGAPEYLIAEGKDDNRYHLYKHRKDDDYKTVVKVEDGNNNLEVDDGTVSTDSYGVSTVNGDYDTGSPLILDRNKDGKVSAQQGQGVDINGDGKADGAAVGGDKMLTMGDVNKNGKIDGTEVFGDKTVDPYTNKPVEAANGFDALNQVAQSAEKASGLDVIDDKGVVNAQLFNQALQKDGKGELGLISEDNVTNPEALGNDIKTINTKGYKEQAATGDVQHRQVGTYTDGAGKEQRVDDVWFKNA